MTRRERAIEAAAAAIANARGGRRGAPPISNILEMLENGRLAHLAAEVREDAITAISAYERVMGEGEGGE